MTARVFFALWPPAPVARQLGAAAADFAGLAGGRATRPETIHLTLAFLGAVPVARLAELEQVAHTVRGAAFDLAIDRYGFWSHNRILWAGCSRTPAALGELAGALAAALAAAGFLSAAAHRTFAPHVTLVRKVVQRDPLLPACAPLIWPCRNFALVRSTLGSDGSSYRRLAELAL